jgi:hypothetical protein
LLASAHPWARRYLTADPGAAVLRVVHNGAAVPVGGEPAVLPEDKLLLMHAVAGGRLP